MKYLIHGILLIFITAGAFTGCSANQEEELEPLNGIVLKMENGEVCIATHERTVIGEFAFEDLFFDEEYENDKMELSDGTALTFVDRRQSQVIEELKGMGFEEVDSSDIPSCSVDDQDMGIGAR